MSQGNPFSEISFTNRLTRDLPADPNPQNHIRRVEGAAYSWVKPSPVANPKLIALIPELLEEIGLAREAHAHPDLLQVLAGNLVPSGMTPYAGCYGGHQFGSWAGQLGDGRAINLGEVRSRAGEHLTIQLKGAGKTPYSRSADGRAVLRSSLREFVASEAMHHLGIPTTRAMSLVMTGERVIRDMFYDGNPKAEPGAITSRIAPSFTRFGHFELPAARQDVELLRKLVDFSISCEFEACDLPSDQDGYAAWFLEIAKRTAHLIAEWQRVGFVHGVMNTDNLSIIGLTIDYGPFGWLDHFDPDWTPNTTDAETRRYTYAAQPEVGRWNLIRLANAIYPLVGSATPLEKAIEAYDACFIRNWDLALSRKLGISIDSRNGDDQRFIKALWDLLGRKETDFTLFFRGLSRWPEDPSTETLSTIPLFFKEAWYDQQSVGNTLEARILAWSMEYQARIHQDGRTPDIRNKERLEANPRFVLRNYLAHDTSNQVEAGNVEAITILLDTLKKPYDDQPGRDDYAKLRPEWARNRAGCSMLSCSS